MWALDATDRYDSDLLIPAILSTSHETTIEIEDSMPRKAATATQTAPTIVPDNDTAPVSDTPTDPQDAPQTTPDATPEPAKTAEVKAPELDFDALIIEEAPEIPVGRPVKPVPPNLLSAVRDSRTHDKPRQIKVLPAQVSALIKELRRAADLDKRGLQTGTVDHKDDAGKVIAVTVQFKSIPKRNYTRKAKNGAETVAAAPNTETAPDATDTVTETVAIETDTPPEFDRSSAS